MSSSDASDKRAILISEITRYYERASQTDSIIDPLLAIIPLPITSIVVLITLFALIDPGFRKIVYGSPIVLGIFSGIILVISVWVTLILHILVSGYKGHHDRVALLYRAVRDLFKELKSNEELCTRLAKEVKEFTLYESKIASAFPLLYLLYSLLWGISYPLLGLVFYGAASATLFYVLYSIEKSFLLHCEIERKIISIVSDLFNDEEIYMKVFAGVLSSNMQRAIVLSIVTLGLYIYYALWILVEEVVKHYNTHHDIELRIITRLTKIM